MASADPNDPNDPNDPYIPPRTPHLKKIDDEDEPLTPDTEEHVAEQTDAVFRNFVYQMHTHEQEEQAQEGTDLVTPSMPELTAFPGEPLGPTWQIGRQLALIGDDLNDRYAPHFGQMIKVLNITPDTAYDAFAGVARKLFRDGNINWGRVITLLCFGYRMAVTVLQRGIRGFFHKVVTYVCRFIRFENIAKWIAEQGGWRAVLRYVPESVGWSTIGLIFSFAALTVATAFFLSRKQS